MNRGEIKSSDRERKEIANIASQPIKIFVEVEEKILSKLFNAIPYEIEDVRKTAEFLVTRTGYDIKTQLQVFEDITKFDEKLTKTQKPVFFIYAKSKNCWVLFCLLHKENKKSVLYKDSSGCDIGQRLEDCLRRKIAGVDILVNTERGHKADADCNYGPLCLRNLKIFLDGIKKDVQAFENGFPQQKFCKAGDLNDDKLWNVIKVINEISENKNFTQALKQFVDNIPSMEFMEEYNRVLEEELKKDKVDYKRIIKVRKECFNENNMNRIKDAFKVDKEENEIEYKFEIQKKFPLELEKLQNILQLLNKTEVDDKLYKALESICEILGIDVNKLKLFYKPKSEEEPIIEDKLTPKSVMDIIKNLPEMKKPSPENGTPFEELMEEIWLGIDPDPSDSSQNDQAFNQQEDKDKIEENYYLVRTKRTKWKNKSLEEIQEWAVQMKGHLTNSDDDICEAIAVMNRAFNLLSGGFQLRDTQVLAALIFLHNQENQGRLCQIQTGEGKTNIVSLLAVVKALQGMKVDVITSNPLLAEDGVKETETFYSVFNLTVSTNNPSENGEAKIGYTADVLYGTISNFQFDYLKDSFEGYNLRKERPFGQVILDEVDSMLVDNGGHIAKLASPFPGMECLRYIYIKIWQALYRAEEEYVEENEAKFRQFLEGSPSEQEYEKFIQEMVDNERTVIKQKIKASDPTNIPLIPLHLQEYVKSKLDMWIKNALHAKYNCHEHQQYRIIKNDDTGEKVVTPVDYLNTGVTMKNTIWSNGLHQFVQLKHNLYLTFESLTSSFISNIGYIKNYDDKNIFGLTGTLGSRAEQELLAHIYNVSYAKLPTYKEKKFDELDGIVVNDDSWSIGTTTEILKYIDEKRAVLAIFETEQDLLSIKDNLQLLQCENFRVRTFANEDNAEETGEKVKAGDIILATNIAGRGTNFRTEESLENNGGLHVLVGCLPCNKRVEDQAFGRTSRQGNSGTGQLVIRQSEVDELEISQNADFKEIKKERDNLEKRRLEDIKNDLVKELDFKDKLFKKFSEFYRKWKESKNRKEDEFLSNDLKEFWAFWLERKNYNKDDIANLKVDDEFRSFCKKADIIINGKIHHNPFYSIGLAEVHLENDDTDAAKKELEHAIDLGGNKHELLGGANLKLFEVAVLNGAQFKQRFNKAIGEILFIPVKEVEEYKKEATEYLKKARLSVETELNYFRKNFFEEAERKEQFSDELEKILVNEKDSSFLKHIFSKYYSLKVHESNIDQLIEQFKSKSVQLDIGGKVPTVPTLLEQLKEDKSDLLEAITNCELNELQSIGIDALYCLKEVPNVAKVIIEAARGEIIAGMAALTAGLIFPPIFPLMSGLASDLISGAIIDLVMAVVVPEEVNTHEYMKEKFMSYGKSLVTLGISAAMQSVRILQKAINFCRKMSKFLREAPNFKKACELLAKLVDKLQAYLKNLLQAAKNAGKVAETSRSKLFVDFMKNTTKQTVKGVTSSIVKPKIIDPYVDEVWNKCTATILNKMKESLIKSVKERESLVQKLKSTKREDIDATIEDFVKMGFVKHTFVKYAPTLIDHLKGKLKLTDSKAQILSIGLVAGVDFSELVRYGKEFSSELEAKLTGGDCANNVEEVIDKICDEIASKMLDVIKKILSEGKDIGGVIIDDKVHSGDGNDLFSVLGLKAEASVNEVKESFRKLVLELHFDKRDEELEELRAAYQRFVE